MAGTIPGLSGQQQFDFQGRPLSGGRLFTYQSGTTTPQSVYQDSALTVLHSNPIILTADGRCPILYANDGSIKFRLENAAGVLMFAGDFVLVVGPSGGQTPGPGVDATTIFATGDVKAVYATGSIVGWVRLAGRTIGSATSGATERANADTQALFLHLWTQDPNLAVSGGRGASAAADFAANKTIQLPDCRGRVLAALDDMGNSAAGRLTASYFGTSAIVLGASGGSESHTLTEAQLPVHNHGSPSLNDPGHVHPYNRVDTLVTNTATAGSSGFRIITDNTTAATTATRPFSNVRRHRKSTRVVLPGPPRFLKLYCRCSSVKSPPRTSQFV